MINLLNLTTEYQALSSMLDESAGVLTPEVEAFMDSIGAKTVAGLFNLQDVREESQGFVKILKERIDDAKRKIDILNRKDENLKKVQIFLLQMSGNKSMTNGAHKITLTQNPLRIEIANEDEVPDKFKTYTVKLTAAEYLRVKDQLNPISVDSAPDKKTIQELYKTSNVEVVGCAYVREDNVRVS